MASMVNKFDSLKINNAYAIYLEKRTNPSNNASKIIRAEKARKPTINTGRELNRHTETTWKP